MQHLIRMAKKELEQELSYCKK